ncbi:MAGE-like protein 2 [Chaetomidium leptoderma]|uniref:MAGE-like protein 2 n=1 Tax=Chaetomidium leptoderma TaxID=669021 RepID=A0AAN6ZW38_9PEZI|nr:MAGE-like protein 2 [Chaetomidium leptoderma]
MARGLPLLAVAPIILNLISLLLLCLVLFSGFNGGLSQIYWLSTDSGDFKVPAKLAGSEYMAALTTVSKTDFVGQGSTAASLGLPDWSSIHLLTECAHFSDGRVECASPRFGFSFLPSRDLKLGGTAALQGTQQDGLTDALAAYSRASGWLSGAYIIATVFSLLAPVESCFAPFWAAFTAGLATLFLFTATVTAAVVFKNVRDAFNVVFASHGLSAALGSYPIALGFVACVLTFAATILYTLAYRREQSGHHHGGGGGDKGVHGGGVVGGGQDSEYHGASSLATRSKAGLFNRVTGGGNHKYVQIDEQQQQQAGQRGGNVAGVVVPGSPDGIRPSRLDEDWAAPDEYSHGLNAVGGAGGGGGGKKSAGPGQSIPLMALGGGNRQTKDLKSGYEPFSETR